MCFWRRDIKRRSKRQRKNGTRALSFRRTFVLFNYHFLLTNSVYLCSTLINSRQFLSWVKKARKCWIKRTMVRGHRGCFWYYNNTLQKGDFTSEIRRWSLEPGQVSTGCNCRGKDPTRGAEEIVQWVAFLSCMWLSRIRSLAPCLCFP